MDLSTSAGTPIAGVKDSPTSVNVISPPYKLKNEMLM